MAIQINFVKIMRCIVLARSELGHRPEGVEHTVIP